MKKKNRPYQAKISFLLAGYLTAVLSASAVEPFMILRFRANQNEDDAIWKQTLEMLTRYRQACDEVWFSTGIGVPPLSWHKKQSERLASAAKQLRSLGILPGLQIQATIGHTDTISASADTSAKVWGGFTGPNGTECESVNCPRQPEFLAYCAAMSKIYAAWKPSSIWIDDDLRMAYHGANETGCYCKTCIAAFSAKEGKEYTRESLLSAMKQDVALLTRWNRFREESMGEVARVIAHAVHEVSPETRMGFQHGFIEGRESVFQALVAESGHKAGARPGGSAYSDHTPYALITKAFDIARQIGTGPGRDLLDRICPEIESYPRAFACKTGHGLAIESLLDLAMGTDCLSYFIMDAHLETPAWYGSALMSELASDVSLFKDYVRFNEGTSPGGVGGGSPLPLACIGMPFCPGSPTPSCHLITEEMARYLPESEVRRYLSGGVLLDGQSIAVLQKRGFSDALGGLTVTPAEKGAREAFTDDELNAGMLNGRHYGSGTRLYQIGVTAETARVIGRYYRWDGKDAGVASVLLETPQGGRIAAFGYDGFQTTYTSGNRIRQLLRAVDWTTQGTLPVLTETPTQCLLIPRVTKSGELRSVAVLNTVIDQQRPFTLRLRGCEENKTTAEWIALGERPVEITVTHNGTDAFVTLPGIAAWNMGWLRL